MKKLEATQEKIPEKYAFVLMKNKNRLKITKIIFNLSEKKIDKITIQNIANATHLDRTTAFRHLNELERGGVLTYTYEQMDTSPPKSVKVYEINEDLDDDLIPRLKKFIETIESST